MRSHLMSFQGYAPGAIRDREHLLDFIIEARKGRKAVRLYAVLQGGYMSEVYITSKTRLTQSEGGIESFNYRAKAREGKGLSRYYRTTHCLGDLNIASKTGRAGGHNRHQLFSNRRLALAYSEALKNDASYQRAIREFHAEMDRLFGDLWS